MSPNIWNTKQIDSNHDGEDKSRVFAQSANEDPQQYANDNPPPSKIKSKCNLADNRPSSCPKQQGRDQIFHPLMAEKNIE